MRLNSKVTLNENVAINGYKTLLKGTQLKVVKYNKKYVYCVEEGREKAMIQLTYKNIGVQSPVKRKKTVASKATSDDIIDRLFAGTL